MAKVVTVLGWVLLAGGIGLVLIGYGGVAMTQGVWAAIQLANPFNIANFILTVIALAPGLLLLKWGSTIKDRQQS